MFLLLHTLLNHSLTPKCTSLLPDFTPLPHFHTPDSFQCSPTLTPLTFRPRSSYFGFLSPHMSRRTHSSRLLYTPKHTLKHTCTGTYPSQLLSSRTSRGWEKARGGPSAGERKQDPSSHTHRSTHAKHGTFLKTHRCRREAQTKANTHTHMCAHLEASLSKRAAL